MAAAGSPGWREGGKERKERREERSEQGESKRTACGITTGVH